MDDQVDIVVAESLADGRGLLAAERAELEAVEVPIEHLARVLHVGVPDEVDAGLGHD